MSSQLIHVTKNLVGMSSQLIHVKKICRILKGNSKIKILIFILNENFGLKNKKVILHAAHENIYIFFYF